MIRYADDVVLVFSNEADARRVQELLARRLNEYGLSLHPTKTRLVDISAPSGDSNDRHEGSGFDFLGFTHYWGRTRKSWTVKRKTASSRFSRTLRRLGEELRRNRHRPVAWQHARIVRALTGHRPITMASGRTGGSCGVLRYEVTLVWRKWLSRRSRGNADAVGALSASAEVLPTSPTATACRLRWCRVANPRLEEPDAVNPRTSGSVGGPGRNDPGLPGVTACPLLERRISGGIEIPSVASFAGLAQEMTLFLRSENLAGGARPRSAKVPLRGLPGGER